MENLIISDMIETNKEKISSSVLKFEAIYQTYLNGSITKKDRLKAIDIINQYGAKSFAYHWRQFGTQYTTYNDTYRVQELKELTSNIVHTTVAITLEEEMRYNHINCHDIHIHPLSKREKEEQQAVSKSRARIIKEEKQQMEEMEEINELQAILNGNIDHTILYQKRIESKAQAHTWILI